jgi:hypothetical protein
MEKLVAALIATHAIADFFLQPGSLVRRKGRMGFLFAHAAFHAVATYAVLQAWAFWQAPAFVFLLHALIDFLKQRCGKDSAAVFVVDQAFHILSLICIAWLLSGLGLLRGFPGVGYRPLVVFGGFVATVQGAGFLIGKFARHLTERNQLELDGLRDGGMLIGQLERALIFLLIFIGEPAGIGFLVAAKSILRFEEAKKQKLAEYVLIGTLLSFSLAIALAVTTKWAMAL